MMVSGSHFLFLPSIIPSVIRIFVSPSLLAPSHLHLSRIKCHLRLKKSYEILFQQYIPHWTYPVLSSSWPPWPDILEELPALGALSGAFSFHFVPSIPQFCYWQQNLEVPLPKSAKTPWSQSETNVCRSLLASASCAFWHHCSALDLEILSSLSLFHSGSIPDYLTLSSIPFCNSKLLFFPLSLKVT